MKYLMVWCKRVHSLDTHLCGISSIYMYWFCISKHTWKALFYQYRSLTHSCLEFFSASKEIFIDAIYSTWQTRPGLESSLHECPLSKNKTWTQKSMSGSGINHVVIPINGFSLRMLWYLKGIDSKQRTLKIFHLIKRVVESNWSFKNFQFRSISRVMYGVSFKYTSLWLDVAVNLIFKKSTWNMLGLLRTTFKDTTFIDIISNPSRIQTFIKGLTF